MKKSILALCLAACAAPPQLLPPPFGPGQPTNTRLFFPSGLAKLPDGSLLVANGNFNHAFEAGTMVTIRKSYLDQFFARQLACEVAGAPAACDDDISTHPADVFGPAGGAVMIGNYAGPLVLNDNDAGTVAYTGSRDTNRLNAVSVQPDLSLRCAPGAGTTPDCSSGVIDLGKSGVTGPYAIASGDVNLPGEAAARPVIFVSSLVPHIVEVSSSLLSTDAPVAALDVASSTTPPTVLFSMLASSRFVANGTAVGPMVFDPVRRQLLLSGCYERFAGGVAEPGSEKCLAPGTNFLRTLKVDGGAATQVVLFDLLGDVLSTDTTALLLADFVPDARGRPATAPQTLWATMRRPDVLVKIDLPTQPSVTPRVRQVVPLPISPADLITLSRKGLPTPLPDLIAIVSEKLGAVVIYDTGQGQVVAQVERLGDSPFSIRQLDSPDPGTARLAVTVFGSCRVALLEVPLNKPYATSLRGRAGSCP